MKPSARAAIVTATVAAALTLSAPAGASTKWICDVPGVDVPVTFVTAADAARHGIETANATAGVTFNLRFGETCHVESS